MMNNRQYLKQFILTEGNLEHLHDTLVTCVQYEIVEIKELFRRLQLNYVV